MTKRQHGYARYKLDGCRCYTCAFAVSQYAADRRRQIAAGTWQPFVDLIDNTEVRAHILAHSQAGVGSRQLALLAGVDRKSIQQARTGNRKGRPCGRMHRDIAERILAVPVADAPVADHALVDATGARRRIQALCAIGWGFRAQSERAGWPKDRWHRVSRETRILASTAALVRDVYDHLSMTPAPAGYAASRARAVAEREGWLPPLAWDDDTIDDPDGRPHLGLLNDDTDDTDEGLVWLAVNGHLAVEELPPAERAAAARHRSQQTVRQADLVERYLKLNAAGHDRPTAARLLGVPLVNLHAALNRARRAGDTRIERGHSRPRADPAAAA